MDKIHISDFPPTQIYVLLTKKFRKKIINKTKENFLIKNDNQLALRLNKIGRKHNVKYKLNTGEIRFWLDGSRVDKRTNIKHPKLMPLWVAVELTKLSKISISKLEKNIEMYRSGGSGRKVYRPKIPVEITPELESIIIHLFADGQASKDYTPAYYQKERKYLENFIKKLENCFGKFEYRINEKKCQVRFPKAITDILIEYYKIESFKSRSCKIPERIMNQKSKRHKLACAIAFISDEGHIRDSVSSYSSNKIFITQIRDLLIDCEYICRPIRYSISSDQFSFVISNKSINEFRKDVNYLSKEYSTCGKSILDKLNLIIRRLSNHNPSNSVITDKRILNELAKNKKTTIEIAKKIGYAHCTVLHHLKNLERQDIVKHKKTGRSHIWSFK